MARFAVAWLLLLSLPCTPPVHGRSLLHSAVCELHTMLGEYVRTERFREKADDFGFGGGSGRAWFQNNWEPSIRCIADKRMGNHGDGGKWVCDPHCLLVQHNCTIFSVGSNNVFDFENALEPFGCRIYTFDHTVAQPTPPAHVTFFTNGLAGEAQANGNLITLKSAYEKTGASGIIDVLKIDCEGCEFQVFRDPGTLAFLRRHVKQILLEVHFQNEQDTIALATNLRDAGFKTFSKEPNIQYSDGSCVEFSMLNVLL